MNKKAFFMALVVLVAGLVLAACTPAAATQEPTETGPEATEAITEAPTETAPEGPTGKVSLWHAYQTGSAEESTLTGLIENAKAEFPGLEIEVLQVPFDQIFNKYQTEVAAGGGPDMFVAPNDDLGNWVRGELVEDLTADLEGKLDGVSETGVAGMQVDGKLYGVPESAKAVALYYNKDLMPEPPATTDELLAFTKESDAKPTFFIGAYHMFGWTGAFGGKLFDDSSKCIADQGGWAEAMDYLVALQDAGATFTGDYGQAEGPFRAGETPYFVNGPWALADYKKDLGDKLGVAVMPVGPDGDTANPFNGIDGFYINPNTQNKEGALALALFLSSGDSAQAYTDSAGHVPIRDSVTSSDPLVATFAQASASGFPRPQTAEFANYWTPFGDMFTKVLSGDAVAADAVAEACAAMNTANGK